jgi:hypothetical protein
MMSQKSIILVVVIFFAIIIGMFWFAYLERQTTSEPGLVSVNPIPDQPVAEVPYYLAQVNAKHYVTPTGHVIVGEVTLPTPCDLLEVSPLVRESFPEQVELQFSITNTAEMCAQVLTTQRFRADVSASPEATFSATYQGQPLILNLIPALPDESPDDFELFIKG